MLDLQEKKPTRFFVDSTVLRLGKWLRLLGIDAPLAFRYVEIPAGACLLTKKRSILNKTKQAVFVPFDRIKEQLTWFASKFPGAIKKENFGSRCIRCNQNLISVSRETVHDRIPDYITQTHKAFMMCPMCKKIYWKGSHMERMEAFLKKINFPIEGEP